MNFCNHESPLVKDLASKFRSRSANDIEFVTLAFNWVRDEIIYAIQTDWTVGVEYTIQHREGNCGTKSCLLVALLRAGGIEHVKFGIQTIATAEVWFHVPSWVVEECSAHSIHFTCSALLEGRWIHFDPSLDMRFAKSLKKCSGPETHLAVFFDGQNHAVIGGHESFDPNNVTMVGDLDKFMKKKSRLQPCLRTALNIAFDFCRVHAWDLTSPKTLRQRVEEHLVNSHQIVFQEISRFLMQKYRSKL